jgi:glycosyltransferase involved in cell wall biosynthesis
MKAVLVNLSSPEMDHLAVELAARSSLTEVVRRYVNKSRWWERSLARLPLLGSAYAGTLGRRRPPQGLDGALVREAAVATDFAAAFVGRVGRRAPSLAVHVGKRLQRWTEGAVAAAGGRRAPRADVVVASYHVALPAFREARKARRRTVLNYPIAHHRWQYRVFAEQAKRYPEFAAALPKFGRVQDHAALLDREIELADVILVGSNFVADTFVSEGISADRLCVIPYGADTQRFEPSPERQTANRPFRVLFVGQIGERKGMSHLLKAYEAFRKPDTALHLVGDYVADPEVYRRFRGLYEHTPNVPQIRLPEIFRAADVFVLPSLVEGMPMVVLEAMSCGLPVIVTPNGPADVVRDGIDGFIVPTCDSAAIADRLEYLYANPELRAQLGRNARQQAEQWTWLRYARCAADVVLRD